MLASRHCTIFSCTTQGRWIPKYLPQAKWGTCSLDFVLEQRYSESRKQADFPFLKLFQVTRNKKDWKDRLFSFSSIQTQVIYDRGVSPLTSDSAWQIITVYARTIMPYHNSSNKTNIMWQGKFKVLFILWYGMLSPLIGAYFPTSLLHPEFDVSNTEYVWVWELVIWCVKCHVSRSGGVGPQVSTAMLLPGFKIGASGMSVL